MASFSSLPTEILEIVSWDATCNHDPLGTCNTPAPALSQVTFSLREIFQRQPVVLGKATSRKPLARARQEDPVKDRRFCVQGTLVFCDLESMVHWFTRGPGSHDQFHFHLIKSIIVDYVDSSLRYLPTWEFAYEAMELLVERVDRMNLQYLQLNWLSYSPLTHETPGIWSLLRLREVPYFRLNAPRGMVEKDFRKALRSRLRQSSRTPWKPLGFENPCPNAIPGRVGRAAWKEKAGHASWLCDRRQLQLAFLNRHYRRKGNREQRVRARRVRREAHDRKFGISKRKATVRASRAQIA